MREQEPKHPRAIPLNAAVVAPVWKIRATIGRDEDGNLTVSNQSSEVVDTLTPEERERRERVSEKIYRHVAGEVGAWDSEVQEHYESEKERYLADGPKEV